MAQKRNFIITRKDFLKQSVSLGLAYAVPGFILTACSGTESGGGSNNSSQHYASFEITFSKQMDRASVEAALSTVPNDASFTNRTIEWSSDNTKFYCKFPCDSAGKNFDVTIAETATDDLGIALDGNGDGTAGDAYPTFSLISV